jgi:hypothetical protein
MAEWRFHKSNGRLQSSGHGHATAGPWPLAKASGFILVLKSLPAVAVTGAGRRFLHLPIALPFTGLFMLAIFLRAFVAPMIT